jgi:hypothetical protein
MVSPVLPERLSFVAASTSSMPAPENVVSQSSICSDEMMLSGMCSFTSS